MMNKKMLCSVVLLILTISCVLAGVDFSQNDYEKALKGDKNLSETRLEGADFSSKNLTGVSFVNADLEGANFQCANLSEANFEHSDLEEVNFSGANLSNVNFYHADLEEANLKGANIEGADFKNAELEYATWVDGRICAEGSIGSCW